MYQHYVMYCNVDCNPLGTKDNIHVITPSHQGRSFLLLHLYYTSTWYPSMRILYFTSIVVIMTDYQSLFQLSKMHVVLDTASFIPISPLAWLICKSLIVPNICLTVIISSINWQIVAPSLVNIYHGQQWKSSDQTQQISDVAELDTCLTIWKLVTYSYTRVTQGNW